MTICLQGEYFLVRDHCIQDYESQRPVMMHRAKCWVPIYWCGQPSANELGTMINKLQTDGCHVSIGTCLSNWPICSFCGGSLSMTVSVSVTDQVCTC